MQAGTDFHLFLKLASHSLFISIALSVELAPEVLIHVLKYLQYGTIGFMVWGGVVM